MKIQKSIYSVFSAIFFSCLAACGGGGGGGGGSADVGPQPAPTPNTFAIGGTVTGLNDGATVVLKSGADTLAVNTNGAISFASPIPANGAFAVTVATQPVGQTCTVANGVGTGVVASISNIAVTCSALSYSIGVSVAGLANGQAVKLQNNGSDTLALSTNGAASFVTPVAHNGSYSITVSEQPIGQVCTVSNAVGSGVVSDVSNVLITCSTITYTVGGSITGLASGKQVSLWLNGSDALTLSTNDAFKFLAKVAHGGGVNVTVATQPIGQICSVSNGVNASTVGDVSDIKVTCSTTTYRVQGSLAGLASGQQVTLRNNGVDALTLTTNGGFLFPMPLAFGADLAITVATQPLSQRCEVGNGIATHVVADVSNITISCSSKVSAQATWMGGSKSVDYYGTASALGVPSTLNIPGARDNAASWTDLDGNFWMFGGWGYELQGSLSSVGRQLDLWKFNSTTKEWTYFGRSNTYNPTGSYGVKGVADPLNWPAVRHEAASWTDRAGNLWLFGGDGRSGRQNDMWKYTPTTGLWTWVTGSDVPEAKSVYGTRGVASPTNTPGARSASATWVDTAGDLWLFGGAGVDDISNASPMDDVWKFNPASGHWTWMGGADTEAGRVTTPQFGVKGVAAPSNSPGNRSLAVTWTDLSGNFWLFGCLVVLVPIPPMASLMICGSTVL